MYVYYIYVYIIYMYVCICIIILCTVILVPVIFYVTFIRLLIQLEIRQIWETNCITNCMFPNRSFIF